MKLKRIALLFLSASLALAFLPSCGYNDIQRNDEAVKASWAEVLNQYQRRFDLIPNLVRTVEAYAKQERDIFIQVAEARSRVGSIQATPEVLNDPNAFARFQQSQSALGGALSRLLVVAENYPQLKSDQNFRDLQAQLEGTENRITVARNRYIKAVQDFNVGIRTFPNVITARIFGYTEKPTFQPENTDAISKPPEVNFGQ
jgi:LemA protein